MENQAVICPRCKSEEVVKRGYIQTEVNGQKRRYFCKSCKRKFIPQDAFYRMRNTPEKITCALDLFYRGLSTRDVQAHFKAFFPHNSDHSTILRWVRRYSRQIAGFTDKLKVTTGRDIELDEMQFFRRKSHKGKGRDENWFIDSIDLKTRFMVSSAYVKSRGGKELKKVVLKIKEKSGKNVQTKKKDGNNAYFNLIKKTL